MSTKFTLTHGPDFHLYREAFDDSHVYMELSDAQFEATLSHVMVRIPLHVWEVIRQQAGEELTFADMSDEDIVAYVEAEVADRKKFYSQTGNKIASSVGALLFGDVDRPYDEQIASGVAHYTRLRDRHQNIKRAIAEPQALKSSATKK